MDKFSPEEQKDLIKEAMKEALKEWLDSQFAQFGRWTLYGILSIALVTLGYLYLNFVLIKGVK